MPPEDFEKARNLGIILGSKHANQRGITSKTVTILQTGQQSKPNTRLNPKEQEYLYSKLIQKNFSNRQCHSVFKSKTNRQTLGQNKQLLSNPPPGLYEPQFLKSEEFSKNLETRYTSPKQIRAQIEDPEDWKDPKV